jgi:hypothetical protein
MKIGAVQKNSQEEIRVTIQNYQGTDVIDLRTYWQNAEGDWIPTKKGISLTYYVTEDVIKLLQEAFEKMPVQAEMEEKEANLAGKALLKMIKRL